MGWGKRGLARGKAFARAYHCDGCDGGGGGLGSRSLLLGRLGLLRGVQGQVVRCLLSREHMQLIPQRTHHHLLAQAQEVC